jgi:hypothetical protein
MILLFFIAVADLPLAMRSKRTRHRGKIDRRGMMALQKTGGFRLFSGRFLLFSAQSVQRTMR